MLIAMRSACTSVNHATRRRQCSESAPRVHKTVVRRPDGGSKGLIGLHDRRLWMRWFANWPTPIAPRECSRVMRHDPWRKTVAPRGTES
jgi:hypothetical protein